MLPCLPGVGTPSRLRVGRALRQPSGQAGCTPSQTKICIRCRRRGATPPPQQSAVAPSVFAHAELPETSARHQARALPIIAVCRRTVRVIHADHRGRPLRRYSVADCNALRSCGRTHRWTGAARDVVARTVMRGRTLV